MEVSIYKSSRQFKKHSADLVYLTSRVITGGVIQGDIRMNGYPKEQATFARVSGYVEQFDVHSPQTTVREALLFSAQLRTRGETTEVITAFVDEVMDLVELHSSLVHADKHVSSAYMSLFLGVHPSACSSRGCFETIPCSSG